MPLYNKDLICIYKDCKSQVYATGHCSHHIRKLYKYGDPGYIHPRYIPKICSFEECDILIGHTGGNGYCQKHNTRLYRHGDPSITIKSHDHPKICTKECCNQKYYAKGLCKSHWTEKNKVHLASKQYTKLTKLAKLFSLTKNQLNGALESWSILIRERDDYICQVCGSKKALEAHHLLYKKYYPKLMFNMNNGITLCKKCHNEITWF